MAKVVIFALLSLLVAVLTSALFVILLPETSPKQNYKFISSEDGTLVWYDTASGLEKLRILSETLKYTGGKFNYTLQSECGSRLFTVTSNDKLKESKAKCWNIQSKHINNRQCDADASINPQDCILMKTGQQNTVYWYGGAEMVSQKWPVNDIKIKKATSFLSSDLPKRYGNVLERYYLSSLGGSVFVDSDTPLFVSVSPNQSICLEASYDVSQVVGPVYLQPQEDDDTISLKYSVCIAETPKQVHEAVTNTNNGFIERPKELPDLKMMKDPIWSTWARYKSSINQTIVEEFAAEILFHNFTNSQLEIDDGYEDRYGDFLFDFTKFPNARDMVDRLHQQGFRVTTWVTPFINLNSKNYAYARLRRYFVPQEDGSPAVIRWWNGRGSVVDFTNVNASTWYENLLLDAKTTYGIDSFKFDAGETSYLPKFGLDYAAIRFQNPSDYTTAYARTAFKIGGKMAEMRSSWKTQNKNFYMRLMDKGSSWSSLRGFQTVIPTALTFSILGYPFILPDMIGGNVYIFGKNNSNLVERELYIRWIELGAFLPSMQFSISPWQYDDTVTRIAHRYVDLHRTVIYDEFVEAANRYVSGEMSLLVAPLWFHSVPEDETVFSIDDEFLVGDKYLVAPILEKGSTERDIYLPGDATVKWKDKMKPDCFDSPSSCVILGGTWIRSYKVSLEEISWWEKII